MFQGFRNGAMVASSEFSTGIAGGIFDVTLGNLFADLDTFIITQAGPTASNYHLPSGSYCLKIPIGQIDIDNATLMSAVPLPATALAMVGILALFALFARKRNFG